MANEISATVSLYASKSGVVATAASTLNSTMAGDQMITNVQIVGTGAELLVFGDVLTIGYLYLKNLDATNYVTVDITSDFSSWPQIILPGESILLKPGDVNIYAKSSASTCNVLTVAIEL